MSDSPPRRPKVCRHCGEPESAHHEFAAQMPPGCQCAPGEWGDYVLDACPWFEGAPGTPCIVCEHDEACHRGQAMTTLLDAARQALEALEANHQWHQDYDEHNGYPGSELAATNVAALTKARTAIAEAEKAEPKVEPLFTHLPKHEPLTDEQIAQCIVEARVNGPFARAGTTSFRIARAVERAHGIGGSNE